MPHIVMSFALSLLVLSLSTKVVHAGPFSVSRAASGLRRLAAKNFNPVGAIYGPGHAFNTTERGIVQFGAAVSLDALTGTHLVVGAPEYDFRTTTPGKNDPGSLNHNGGGVFFYEFDEVASTWTDASTPLWTIYGDTDEEVGEFLALNLNGTRVAIRRYNQYPHYVQVFDLPKGVQVGSNISCSPTKNGSPINGDSLAFAASGSRLALQCKTSTGRLEVFDFDENLSDWILIGALDGSATGDLFGFTSSFSESGNRLAVASPNGLESGFFQVFDYAAGSSPSWNQVGQSVLAAREGGSDQFGYSIHMSADGNSVVASAPSAAGFRGSVSVFSYNSSSSIWAMVGAPVFGYDAKDKLGRAVQISGDGTSFAASSWANSEARGLSLLFRYNATLGDWMEVASIGGDNRGDRLGFGRFGLSLHTKQDGVRLAVGETWTGQGEYSVGRVLVMESSSTEVVTDAPTFIHTSTPNTASPAASPTVFPSNAPTEEATDTATLSPTASPSTIATAVPTFSSTIALSPFDWDIERTGGLMVDFADDAQNNRQEVIFYYIIHKRAASVKVFESDCLTPAQSVNTAEATSTPLSDTHDLLKISLDFVQESILESTIFDILDSESGLISLCTRVDLLDSVNQSVVFHEQKLLITVNMLSNFTVSAIDLEMESPDVETVSSDYSPYGVSACQCNPAFECSYSTITQNHSVVYLCVSSASANIEINGVRDLQLSQDNSTYFPINNGTLDNFTSVMLYPSGNGSLAVIQTFLLSAFFVSAGDVLATGSVSLSFVADDGKKRRLNAPVALARESSQEQQSASSFGVELGVASNDVANGMPSSARAQTFGLSLLLAGFAWAFV